MSSVGPSAELAEILERLGNMDKRHLSLEERVKLLEDEIKKKADKGDLDKIGKHCTRAVTDMHSTREVYLFIELSD